MIDLLIILWLLATLLFVNRLICALFSAKVTGQMKRHPFVHACWGFSVFAIIPLLLVVLISWPPVWLERRHQREQLAERLQSAGGWDAVWKNHVRLAQQNPDGFEWYLSKTNSLPNALATLKPRFVDYEPVLGRFQIDLFGGLKTGGHSMPLFNLEIDISTNSPSYDPHLEKEKWGCMPWANATYEKVAEGVYEVYNLEH